MDFKNGVIIVEGTKNKEIHKVPVNKKLTETLERGKKVSKGEYVFLENGMPHGGIKTDWRSALKKAKIKGFRFQDLHHTFGNEGD